ncbi:MAG: hypothetical protein C5S40_02560 [ANME-2 cluster archaeon]|nr:hypothetical protein [ANME-2 cluster archaeon]
MLYKIIAHPRVQKELQKLFEKNKVRYSHMKKRLEIISDNPEIGKTLRNILTGKLLHTLLPRPRQHESTRVAAYQVHRACSEL